MTSRQDRYRGCLLGLAAGDAVGTSVEFRPRGSFPPVTGMAGGGPFGLKPGQWTDDTSMALCLAASLCERGGFDARDQMERYARWAREGYMSSNGACFDIGSTVSAALRRFREIGDPFAGSTDPRSAGNGCLMRLAPVPMFYFSDPAAVETYSAESARTTHGAAACLEATRLFGRLLRLALGGQGKSEILAAADYREKPVEVIRGSGYVVESLEAALWCFARADDFKSAVLLAANLGEDADTTAAICGQLAGAHYGVGGIPSVWLDVLARRELIGGLADSLFLGRRDCP